MPRRKRNNNKARRSTRLSGQNIRRRRRNIRNSIPYALRSGPVRLGPGSNVMVCTQKKPIPRNTALRVNIKTAFLSNPEFSNKSEHFKFFKLIEVRVLFMQNAANEQNFLMVNLSWQNNQSSPSIMTNDDSTKYVPFYRTRNRVLKYLPPRMTMEIIEDSDPLGVYINPSEWQPSDLVFSKFPGNLFIENPSTIYDDLCIIEFVVAFRGNDQFENLLFKPFPKGSTDAMIKLDRLEYLEKEAKENKEKNIIKNKINKEFPKKEFEYTNSDQAFLRRRIDYLAQRLDSLRLQLKDAEKSNLNENEYKEVEKLVNKILKNKEDEIEEIKEDKKFDKKNKIVKKEEVLSEED